jgi:hypothetical protein
MVSLPVEITRLNITKTFRLRTTKKDQVCGKKVIAFDSTNITDFYIAPSLCNKCNAIKDLTGT